MFIWIPPSGILQNAAKGRVKGFEYEGSFKVTPDLSVSAGGAYLSTKYTSFPAAAVYTPTGAGNIQGPQDVTGNKLIHTPKFTAVASIDYSHLFAIGRVDAHFGANYNYGFLL